MVKNEITSMKLLESDNINNINKLKYKINTSKNITITNKTYMTKIIN